MREAGRGFAGAAIAFFLVALLHLEPRFAFYSLLEANREFKADLLVHGSLCFWPYYRALACEAHEAAG